MKRFLFLPLFSLFLLSCTDDDKSNDSDKAADQAQFLQNTSVIISSSYEAANTSALLMAATSTDVSNGDFNRVSDLRDQLKQAWIDYQKISFLEFGVVGKFALKSNVNIYKTDTALIESSIRNGNFDLNQLSMKNAKGFPALDYLLNQKSLTETKSAFQDSNRLAYVKALTDDISNRITAVRDEWFNNKSQFISSTGTSVGSSTGMLINALNQHYEKYFRDNKIGIPLGVRSSGIARPDYVEAVYGQYSIDLALENLNAMKSLYHGINSSDIDGYGLDNYLIDSDASDLNTTIEQQLQTIELKLKALNDPLPDQIQNNSAQVQNVYTEMQQLIVLWKVDMPSRLGILITYQDNDGD